MSNIDFIKLKPDSILDIKTGSNNEKLWKLFANQMDEIDRVFEDMRLVRDFLSQSGVILDLIGEIVHEKRNGKDDPAYRIYLAIAIKKMLSNGSIDILNDIVLSILEDDFIGIRELYPSQINQPWGEDLEYQLWLDGTWYLDGRYMLAGNVFQPAFFEIRLNESTPENLKSYISNIIAHTKGGGIAYQIKEV
ncbi:MAG: hypothetical protein JW807_00950 [Spirochaetes bacterium]|nr:hypothetical protein [Spirochaetota bacterium]